MPSPLTNREIQIVRRHLLREIWAWRQSNNAASVEDFDVPVPVDPKGLRLTNRERLQTARRLINAGAFQLAIRWFRKDVLKSADPADSVRAAEGALAVAGNESHLEALKWANHALQVLLEGNAGRLNNPFDLGHVISALDLALVFRRLGEEALEGQVREFLKVQLPNWVQNSDVGLMALKTAVELGYEEEIAWILKGFNRLAVEIGSVNFHIEIFKTLISHGRQELVWSILGRAYGSRELAELRERARTAAIALRDYHLAMLLVDDRDSKPQKSMLTTFAEPIVNFRLACDWHLVIDRNTNPMITTPIESSFLEKLEFLAQLVPHASRDEQVKMYIRGKELHRLLLSHTEPTNDRNQAKNFLLVLAAWAGEKSAVTRLLKQTEINSESASSLLSAAIHRGHRPLLERIETAFPAIHNTIRVECARKQAGLPNNLEDAVDALLNKIEETEDLSAVRPLIRMLGNQYKETELIQKTLWKMVNWANSADLLKLGLRTWVAETGDLELWDALACKVTDHVDVIDISDGFWSCLGYRLS